MLTWPTLHCQRDSKYEKNAVFSCALALWATKCWHITEIIDKHWTTGPRDWFETSPLSIGSRFQCSDPDLMANWTWPDLKYSWVQTIHQKRTELEVNSQIKNMTQTQPNKVWIWLKPDAKKVSRSKFFRLRWVNTGWRIVVLKYQKLFWRAFKHSLVWHIRLGWLTCSFWLKNLESKKKLRIFLSNCLNTRQNSFRNLSTTMRHPLCLSLIWIISWIGYLFFTHRAAQKGGKQGKTCATHKIRVALTYSVCKKSCETRLGRQSESTTPRRAQNVCFSLPKKTINSSVTLRQMNTKTKLLLIISKYCEPSK